MSEPSSIATTSWESRIWEFEAFPLRHSKKKTCKDREYLIGEQSWHAAMKLISAGNKSLCRVSVLLT